MVFKKKKHINDIQWYPWRCRNWSQHHGRIAISFLVVVFSCLKFFSSQRADTIRLAISLSLSSPSLPPYPLTYTLCHLHSLDIHKHRWHKKTPIWWINLYILEPIPVLASILMRPCLLLSRVPLQPSGVISLLAVLNSLIICVLHKKRTIPQWHITACWAWFGLALMWIGCCVVSAL